MLTIIILINIIVVLLQLRRVSLQMDEKYKQVIHTGVVLHVSQEDSAN